MSSIEQYLDECYHLSFESVLKAWGVSKIQRIAQGPGAYYIANADGVLLRLTNDRGCMSCEVGSVSNENDLIDVELFAQSLDYIGKTVPANTEGLRRWTLQEQCEFLITQRTGITTAVCPQNWSVTREVARKLGLARFNCMFGHRG